MSRNTSVSSAGGNAGAQQALITLMREYQAVSDSLALAREQIEREGQRMGSSDHGRGGQRQQQPVRTPNIRSNNNTSIAIRSNYKTSQTRLLFSKDKTFVEYLFIYFVLFYKKC